MVARVETAHWRDREIAGISCNFFICMGMQAAVQRFLHEDSTDTLYFVCKTCYTDVDIF